MSGVLAEMTKGIQQRKTAAAGPKLTPVKGETGVKPSEAREVLPNDTGTFMSNERIREASADLRAKAALLIEVADGLDLLVGTQDPIFDKADDAPVKKKKPIEARLEGKDPAKFAEEYAAKSAAAQAATFVAADATSEEPEAPEAPATGWVCPEHGDTNLSVLQSRTRGAYSACLIDDCNRFEKPKGDS